MSVEDLFLKVLLDCGRDMLHIFYGNILIKDIFQNQGSEQCPTVHVLKCNFQPLVKIKFTILIFMQKDKTWIEM